MKTQKTTQKMKGNFIWILTSLMFIGLLGLTSMSLAAGGTWTRKADMPTARHAFSTSVVNGKIYAVGGSLNVSFEYNPTTDAWTEKADMPAPQRLWLSTSVVNGKIYAIGGTNGSGTFYSTVQEYNPATDTWMKKASMPSPRSAFSTNVVNEKIYDLA